MCIKQWECGFKINTISCKSSLVSLCHWWHTSAKVSTGVLKIFLWFWQWSIWNEAKYLIFHSSNLKYNNGKTRLQFELWMYYRNTGWISHRDLFLEMLFCCWSWSLFQEFNVFFLPTQVYLPKYWITPLILIWSSVFGFFVNMQLALDINH